MSACQCNILHKGKLTFLSVEKCRTKKPATKFAYRKHWAQLIPR